MQQHSGMLMTPRSAGNILIIVQNLPVPFDRRVWQETNTLRRAGFDVAVICPKSKTYTKSYERLEGVDIYRYPLLIEADNSVVGYFLEFAYCWFATLWLALKAYGRRPFHVIHACNPPDTYFAVALLFRPLGVRFVFDHHDLCPELYRSRYRTGEDFFTRLLRVFEWCSLKLADVTIATNESYKQVEMKRAKKDPQTIFIVRNGPDKLRMSPVPPSPRLKAMNKCILCYVGSLNPQDGVDYLLRSLRYLLHDLKRSDFHCVIMGSGDSLQDLRDLAATLQLNGCVELTGFIPDEDLQANLAAADICVDPDPSSPLNDVSTWIKVMEYMAYAKPIVSFDLKETRFSAGEAAMYVKPNGEPEFAQTIVQLMEQPELRKKMGTYGRQRVEQELQWTKVGPNLLAAYETLLAEK